MRKCLEFRAYFEQTKKKTKPTRFIALYESDFRRIWLFVGCTKDVICGVGRLQTVQNGRKFDLFESGRAKIAAMSFGLAEWINSFYFEGIHWILPGLRSYFSWIWTICFIFPTWPRCWDLLLIVACWMLLFPSPCSCLIVGEALRSWLVRPKFALFRVFGHEIVSKSRNHTSLTRSHNQLFSASLLVSSQ